MEDVKINWSEKMLVCNKLPIKSSQFNVSVYSVEGIVTQKSLCSEYLNTHLLVCDDSAVRNTETVITNLSSNLEMCMCMCNVCLSMPGESFILQFGLYEVTFGKIVLSVVI